MQKRNNRVITIVALLVAVVALSVGFAALSTTLTINGTGKVKASNWDIHFANLAKPSLTGMATEVTSPTLTVTNIGDYSVELTAPGDSIEYTFDIVNSGSYNAKISSITIPTPECGQVARGYSPAYRVCDNLAYTLTYVENGETVKVDDTLNSNETKKVKLKLTYSADVTADELENADFAISNLGISIIFVQN